MIKSLSRTKPTVNDDDMKKLQKFTDDFGQEGWYGHFPPATEPAPGASVIQSGSNVFDSWPTESDVGQLMLFDSHILFYCHFIMIIEKILKTFTRSKRDELQSITKPKTNHIEQSW